MTGRPLPQARGTRTRRRVCIIRQNDYYDPAVQREAEALADAGFDVEVICTRADNAARRSMLNGVTIIRLPGSRQHKTRTAGKALAYGWFFLCATAFLSVQHIRRPYAVVQANSMPDFLVFAAFIPKLLGSRIVAKMQEPTPELAETIYGARWIVGVLARVEQRAIRFADHTVTVTDQLKQRYVERGAAAEKITVVLNCVDPRATFQDWSPPQPASRPEFVVVCHGTIEDRYGQDTIIEAAGLLCGELPDLRVVLTGRGSGITAMERAIADNELDGVVRFEGWVSRARLNDILYTADVGIVAQKASPYSHLVHTNKMVDYWIFGLPVIASRLRAVSEIYDDHVIEYFEPGSAADLAAAIRNLHDNNERRRELARNGTLAQLQNGWKSQLPTYLRVFDELIGELPSGAPRDQEAAVWPTRALSGGLSEASRIREEGIGGRP